MNKINVVFWGTPDFVIPILQSLAENFSILAVITSPDRRVGRLRALTPSPVGQFSENLGILTLKPEKLTDVAQQLASLHPDLFVVAAYGKIIPRALLDIPQYGALNIHPSLLPKYRGPSPIQTAILNGDKISGVSIIKMDAEMDHGPVIYTREIMVSNQDTFDTLSKKLFAQGATHLVSIIPDFIRGNLALKEQNHAIATYCPIIKKEDGYFEIDNPPPLEKLDRMIRAYYPWPTAWTKWNNKIVKFLPEGLVQMEGKKPVKLKEFLRGYSDFPVKQPQ